MAKKSNKKRSDGRVAVQIYIGKDDDGKRKYKTVYGATQKEANEKAESLRIQMRNGIDIARDLDTFAQWSERWLKSREATVDETTIGTDRTRIGYFVEQFGDVPLKNINVCDIQDVLNALARKNPHTHKPTAKQTLGYIRNNCIAVFEFAIENRATQYNPARYAKIPQKAPKQKRRALTDTERRWIREFPHRAQPAMMIFLYSGLRRGELTALTWNDIDLKNATIRVDKSYDFKNCCLKPPKTESGNRTVPIPKVLVDYLQTLPRKSPYVITTASGRMMTADAWKKLLKSYLADLNVRYGYEGMDVSKHDPAGLPMRIEPFTLHCLRHTYSTMLYEADIDALVAQHLMGHANVETTMKIYTHLNDTRKDTSIKLLDEYLTDASQMQVKNAADA